MSKFVLAIWVVAIEYPSHDVKEPGFVTTLQPGYAEICSETLFALLFNRRFIKSQGRIQDFWNGG